LTKTYGPTLPISEEVHSEKYRSEGETFEAAMQRVARGLADTDEHEAALLDILLNQRFLPAGRVQAAIGSNRSVTPYNCFVSRTIEDSMDGIMDALKEAATTMRMGGGIGYDFSTLRPRGDRIVSLDSVSSGPVAFMDIFNALCGTISSAGHRRGAQMGILRVDHPDIYEFVRAKTEPGRLTNFNISVAVTDEFMEAVRDDKMFALKFNGEFRKWIIARDLWERIMQATWDWAEPGVLFIDRINNDNNLNGVEHIAATNPCAEQPLPPHGACLLGSFNLVKYVVESQRTGERTFDWAQFRADIPHVVRAMDNVVDRALYPLNEQAHEAKSKRRMGLGVTGLANCIEALEAFNSPTYGSNDFVNVAGLILETLANDTYKASAYLAAEKGVFPLYTEDMADSPFIKRLDPEVQGAIKTFGLRNSHLTSIAPTGTISLSADNVSSGIEPVFSYGFDRTIQKFDGPKVERVDDYGVRVFDVKGKTAEQCSVDDHLRILEVASYWSDSAVSKTCNIGDGVTFEEFQGVYMKAWEMGAKGCTTFRAAGKRMGILVAEPTAQEENEGAACYIDPETGNKSCS
jgi:ribonucleoside-diphosphate reductase alpha chain